MTRWPCIFKWIQFALGIRCTCSMQTLIEPVDTTIQYQAAAGTMWSALHQKDRNVPHVLLDWLASISEDCDPGMMWWIPLWIPSPQIQRVHLCCSYPIVICMLLESISAFSHGFFLLQHVSIVEQVSKMFWGEIPFQGSMALSKLLIRATMKYTPL